MTSTIPHAMLCIKLPRLPLNSHHYLLIIFPLAWLFAFCTLWASCTQLSNIRRNNFFSDPSAMCMALLFNTLASVRKGKRKRLKLCPHVTYMFKNADLLTTFAGRHVKDHFRKQLLKWVSLKKRKVKFACDVSCVICVMCDKFCVMCDTFCVMCDEFVCVWWLYVL